MKPRPKVPRILIVGIGNQLLQDDGVGVHAVKALEKELLPGVVIAEVGTAVLSALHLIEWAEHVVVIDAMQADGPPGAIYLSHGRDIREPSQPDSLHEVSFMSALRFLHPEHPLPDIRVIGVEPETIAYGLDLSPSLVESLPKVVAVVKNMVKRLKCGHC
jgi:hydrogenase maturation protease